MKEKKKDLSSYDHKKIPSGKSMHLGIVVSDWNPEITSALLDGCKTLLTKQGVKEDNMVILNVPGTFELTSGANLLIKKRQVDGVICLGCVVKGETRHDEYINRATANGLTNLAIAFNKPVIFGVLTTENMQQAEDRSGGKHGNKGIEATITALKMIELYKNFNEGSKKIGF